jgi:hypothetical protein
MYLVWDNTVSASRTLEAYSHTVQPGSASHSAFYSTRGPIRGLGCRTTTHNTANNNSWSNTYISPIRLFGTVLRHTIDYTSAFTYSFECPPLGNSPFSPLSTALQGYMQLPNVYLYQYIALYMSCNRRNIHK